jgi:hypothetical protein
MKWWTIGAVAMGMTAFSLHSSEEQAGSDGVKSDQKEVVEVGKQPSAPAEVGVKRRWTKRAKPGAPKARKASPSRKKVATLDEQKMISMDEEELDEGSENLEQQP